MNNNLIQWPKAVYWTKTFNPIVGCEPCSPACENCYAKAWADRFKISFAPHRTTKQNPPTRGICFCGNVTDLFGDWVYRPVDFIRKAINWRSNATYLWLTKRVDNMCNALKEVDGMSLFNHYFGFTAENQEWFDRRMKVVEDNIPDTQKLWLSAEPLLGPIELHGGHYRYFDWVVVGCESGPNRRPCEIKWIEDIVDACLALEIPVFVKQLVLPNGTFTNKIDDFPKHLQIRQVPWNTEKWIEELKTKSDSKKGK